MKLKTDLLETKMRTRKNVVKKKMRQCPECGKSSIATIFYGYPCDMDLYLQAIKDKKIVVDAFLKMKRK